MLISTNCFSCNRYTATVYELPRVGSIGSDFESKSSREPLKRTQKISVRLFGKAQRTDGQTFIFAVGVHSQRHGEGVNRETAASEILEGRWLVVPIIY